MKIEQSDAAETIIFVARLESMERVFFLINFLLNLARTAFNSYRKTQKGSEPRFLSLSRKLIQSVSQTSDNQIIFIKKTDENLSFKWTTSFSYPADALKADENNEI